MIDGASKPGQPAPRAFLHAVVLTTLALVAASSEARGESAADPVLASVAPGARAEDVATTLRRARLVVTEYPASGADAGLRAGLVETGLLFTLAELDLSLRDGPGAVFRSGVRVLPEVRLDSAARMQPETRMQPAARMQPAHEFGVISRVLASSAEDRRYVIVLRAPNASVSPPPPGSRHTVSVIMVSFLVPVDATRDPATGGWAPDRLHRLREAMSIVARSGYDVRPARPDARGNEFRWEGANARGDVARLLYLPDRDELRVVVVSGSS